MIRKSLIALSLGCMMTFSALAADVFVRIGPPRPVHERRLPPPGRGYVWTPGYHRWNGNGHEWVGGRWQQPPRARAHWVPARWVRRPGGWVLMEGHWR
jgi:WXXGXW repeat (2 copies)